MHNLRLFLIKNRFNILTSALGIALALVVLLQFIILVYIANSLRGLTCVSLIPSDSRTTENVEQCINDNGVRDFDFIPIEAEVVKSMKGEKGDPGYTPVKGVDYFDGINGTNGVDGKNGQDGKDALSAYELWLSEGNTGSLSEFLASLEGEPGQPGRELIIQCIGGFFMSQYQGDDEWQIIGEGCDG